MTKWFYIAGETLKSAALIGVICLFSWAITKSRREVLDELQRISEVQQAKAPAAMIQVFETPDHRWQIRVARPVDGLFEIVPIDPENLPGGQPIGQKPGI
jgi:hypothetical protein